MYRIIGKYQGKSEVLDETETMKEAIYLKQEYLMAFGPGWIISIELA